MKNKPQIAANGTKIAPPIKPSRNIIGWMIKQKKYFNNSLSLCSSSMNSLALIQKKIPTPIIIANGPSKMAAAKIRNRVKYRQNNLPDVFAWALLMNQLPPHPKGLN